LKECLRNLTAACVIGVSAEKIFPGGGAAVTTKNIISAGTLLISLVIVVGTDLGLAWACARGAGLSGPRVAGLTAPARRAGPNVVLVSDSRDVGTLKGVALGVGAEELSGASPDPGRD
jgi:hypothetical protein